MLKSLGNALVNWLTSRDKAPNWMICLSLKNNVDERIATSSLSAPVHIVVLKRRRISLPSSSYPTDSETVNIRDNKPFTVPTDVDCSVHATKFYVKECSLWTNCEHRQPSPYLRLVSKKQIIHKLNYKLLLGGKWYPSDQATLSRDIKTMNLQKCAKRIILLCAKYRVYLQMGNVLKTIWKMLLLCCAILVQHRVISENFTRFSPIVWICNWFLAFQMSLQLFVETMSAWLSVKIKSAGLFWESKNMRQIIFLSE